MAKEIPLTQGQVAIVDDEDYEYLNQWKWHACIDTKRGKWYAQSSKSKGKGMHRVITNAPKGMVVDHINHDTLDNRKKNLRVVSHRQNLQNIERKGTSKFPGVSWDNYHKKWRGRITLNGKWEHLGFFKDELEAAKAYERACRELVGEELVCKSHLKNEGE